ncbi:MAG: hypothetical protein LBP53_00165 [Candidatus Peribacteria bacterium]|nr:hypothetical protein [Candidatus Peribacteria bacterium]
MRVQNQNHNKNDNHDGDVNFLPVFRGRIVWRTLSVSETSHTASGRLPKSEARTKKTRPLLLII